MNRTSLSWIALLAASKENGLARTPIVDDGKTGSRVFDRAGGHRTGSGRCGYDRRRGNAHGLGGSCAE